MSEQVEEGDYFISNGGVFQYEKCITNLTEWDDIERFICDHAKKGNFFPNVWIVSDHGNYHLTIINYNSDISYF